VSRHHGSALALLVTAAVSWAAVSRAAQPEPRQVFPRRARIEAGSGAVVRATLPAQVLAEARPDLADLRIVSESGRFVPFAIGPAGDPHDTEKLVRSAPIPLDAVDRGADAKGRPRWERLAITPQPRDFVFDRISFELPAGARVIARALVTVEGADQAVRPISAQAPLFQLPGGAGRDAVAAQRVTIPVERGRYAKLEISISIEEGDWVSPAAIRLERSDVARAETGELELELRDTTSDDQHTVLDVGRPPGIVPRRLRIETTSPAFVREVRVRDVGGRRLGHGAVLRRPSGDFSSLTVDLDHAPSGNGDLYVEVDDAGEGALDGLRVFAEVALPSVVLAPFPDEPAHLYWSGGRITTASHRELESFAAMAPATSADAASGAAPALWWQRLPAATLAAPEANPFYKDEPAMAFAQRAGPVLDSRAWSSERELVVEGAPEGLAEWIPQAQDLALLRDDFADLRIVDGESRQIAYLLAGAPPLTHAARFEPAKAEPHTSRWKLWMASGGTPDLALEPVAIAAIDLSFGDLFFSRRVRVLGSWSRRSEQMIGETQAERRNQPGTEQTGTVHVDLPGSPRLGSAIVEVEDGDDPPLSLAQASFHLPTQRVLFAAPPGRYRALLGNPRAVAPHYELEGARDLALSVVTGESAPGALAANAHYRKPSLLSAPDTGSLALWIALGASVLVLAGFTLKLARESSGQAPPPAS